ncbi:MAG: hypothetical protein RLZZ500_1729 [Bacteroidota bacterium]|jgi:hypothetical protein
MAKNKTTYTGQDVTAFIHDFVENEQKRNDSFALITLLKEWTGEEPRMWGPSIIGFGNYHYKYASGHEGEAPVLSFSPRKNALTLYLYSHTPKSEELLPQLGTFKKSKACIYVKKLADIQLTILRQLCQETIAYIQEYHECSCRML